MNVSIVLPCYNEAKRLDPGAVSRFLETGTPCRVCFVDDGSTDETRAILHEMNRLHPDRISDLRLDENIGKAEAVRAGMLHELENADLDYAGFWDADLATPLEESARFLEVFERREETQCVIGSRVRRLGARIERRGYRHLAGRAFAAAARGVLKLPVYDTQCGAKMFRAGIARELFQEPFLSPWFFDVELLARIIHVYGRAGALRMVDELPLTAWRDVAGSKIGLKDWMLAPLELRRIKKHHHLPGEDDGPGKEPA